MRKLYFVLAAVLTMAFACAGCAETAPLEAQGSESGYAPYETAAGESGADKSAADESGAGEGILPLLESIAISDGSADGAIVVTVDENNADDAEKADGIKDIAGTVLGFAIRRNNGQTLIDDAADGLSFEEISESDAVLLGEETPAALPWIRIVYKNFSPTGMAAGGAPSQNKDILIFYDPSDPKDAVLAWQRLDDGSKWSVYSLPEYGDWLSETLALWAK